MRLGNKKKNVNKWHWIIKKMIIILKMKTKQIEYYLKKNVTLKENINETWKQ
jgi:hypothetical protein